jgi:hypothetical protein
MKAHHHPHQLNVEHVKEAEKRDSNRGYLLPSAHVCGLSPHPRGNEIKVDIFF